MIKSSITFNQYLKAFCISILILVPLLAWNIIGSFGGGLNEKITAATGSLLAVLAFLTWITYTTLAKLAGQQNEIAGRNLWLTGALESHSTGQYVMRAHELGIPVMLWDPTQEKWDPQKMLRYPKNRHRQIMKQPVVILYIPESERAGLSKKEARESKPFTKIELRAMDKERKRLSHEKKAKRH